jgi:hypothetical protein
LKFHFKFEYKESLKDYLTTSKGIDLCIKNLNCNPSLSAAPFEYESVEMYFAFLTKETALLFEANHGRQVSNKNSGSRSTLLLKNVEHYLQACNETK